jgi:hypothetical protein
MSVYSTIGIQANTTVISVNQTNNTVVLSLAPTITANNQTLMFWIDSALIDGIAGWDEYVIIDAILKGCASEKIPISDPSLLEGQLEKMNKRIEAMAEGRDQGQASHVSDALSLNGYGSDDDGMGGPFGGGWGGSGGGY